MGEVETTNAAGTGETQTAPAAWPAQGWFEGRYAGRETFRQLLRDGLAAVARAGVSELILSDPDFSDWPIGERTLVQTLTDWALAGSRRRMTLLAVSYDEVVRRHALFVKWRVRWAHKIECRRWCEGAPLQLPSVLWTPQWAMRRDSLDSCAGWASCDPRWRVALREQIQEWLPRSTSTTGFPASVLGL